MKIGVVLALAVVLAACGSSGDDVGATTTQPTSSTVAESTTTQAPTTPTTAAAAGTAHHSAYFIGNSLTNDTLGPIAEGFRSFYVLARQADFTVEPLGWHIRCGSSLVATAAQPDDVCVDPVEPYGTFTDALPGTGWDFVVVQPYPGPESTLAADIEVINEIASTLPDTTTILVLTGWPPHPNFSESWDDAAPITDDSPTAHSRRYFDTLLERLQAELDQDVRLIPSAEVLYRLQDRLAAGDVPGTSQISDLYRDEVHLTSRGQWLSGVTAAAVMTGAPADTFGKPSSWYGDSAEFSAEYIEAVRSVVAEVLGE